MSLERAFRLALEPRLCGGVLLTSIRCQCRDLGGVRNGGLSQHPASIPHA